MNKMDVMDITHSCHYSRRNIDEKYESAGYSEMEGEYDGPHGGYPGEEIQSCVLRYRISR